MKCRVFEVFGCEYDKADRVYVIRERDINIRLARIVLGLMNRYKTPSPQEFFEKSKICFLTNSTLYEKFLEVLSREAKKL